MGKFTGYVIAVPIVMVLATCLVGYLRGAQTARTVVVFFLGWIVGAISMFIKATLVYKYGR